MELKVYLNILLKKWWIVVPIFLVTVTTAIVITYSKIPIYRAASTYVIAPSSSFGDVQSYATGLNILSNREAIAQTYAVIIGSVKITNIAAEAIGIDSTKGYSISSDLLKGTNIIKITVEGPDPTIVRDLANGIGATSEKYIEELYEVYEVSSLDEAQIPRSPISPNRTQDILLAVALGLVLGGSVAFFVQYLEPLPASAVNFNILDQETGVYNKQYFLQRLGEEMLRAKRNHYPLSLALMHLDNLDLLQGDNMDQIHREALHYLGTLVKQYMREEDLLAYLGENTFAFLLLDTPGTSAQVLMEYLQTRISFVPFQSPTNSTKLNLKGIAGIASYDRNGTRRDQFMDMAAQALELAKVSEDGKIYLNDVETYSLS